VSTEHEPPTHTHGDGAGARRGTIELQKLSKRYGSSSDAALDVSSLTIHGGELLSLLGPSGCGKSTTLRIIAGLEEPSGGQVILDGRDVTQLSPADRDVAMVFQNYALYPHFDVRRNLEYGLRKRKVPRQERERAVKEVSEILHLEELLQRKPKELSGGQQQRVAVGRAMVRSPKVFLFDEPLSNLDSHLRNELRRQFMALHLRLHATMVYVTHDQHEAMTMSDRIAIMGEGKVVQCGTPQDVYSRPVNRYVATFVGSPSMNMLRGSLSADSCDVLTFTSDGVTIPLGALKEASPNLAVGRKVELGARPESVSICAPSHGHARGRVSLVEPTGPDTYVTVETGAGKVVAREGSICAVAVGDTVGLDFSAGQQHLFDIATGDCISN